MALRTPPSWLQNGSHPAENDRLSMQAIIATSGIINTASFLVTQAAAPAMAVQSAAGWGAIVGSFTTNMGVYQFYNDAATQLTVTTANPSNPRIDKVVVTVSDAYYTGSSNTVAFQVIAGTPAASPVAPATPVDSLSLATIAVAAGATSITNANITDTRVSVTTNLPVGDLTEVAAGTGITVTSGTGPIPSVALTTPVAVANGGTGITSFGTGIATFLGTPSSANLLSAMTDETGSGALVFATSPTLITPTLGTASATAIELGHASDTTLARASAGVVNIEGVPIVTTTATQTLTNKTLTSPVLTTPTISTVDAKGDLLVGTADNTIDRLAVGNNGETLVADSSTSTGLRYQANTSAGKNGLINGSFTISQRGATITGINTDNTYTADRWYITRGGSIDYAQKTVAGGSTPPANFDAYAQYVNQSAANVFLTIGQTLETKDSMRFAGQSVTLSFYARAAANTVKSKTLQASITYNTTADTKTNTSVGDTIFTITYGTTAGDWARYTLTQTVPSTAKSVGMRFLYNPVGGLAVGDGVEITGIQLEVGSVATAFQTATGNQGSELASCQRYYYRSSSTNLYGAVGTGIATGLTAGTFLTSLPVAMRVVPTSIEFSTLQVYSSTVALAVSALTLNTSQTTTTIGASNSTHANATTADYFYILRGANSAAAYIGYSAEL